MHPRLIPQAALVICPYGALVLEGALVEGALVTEGVLGDFPSLRRCIVLSADTAAATRSARRTTILFIIADSVQMNERWKGLRQGCRLSCFVQARSMLIEKEKVRRRAG